MKRNTYLQVALGAIVLCLAPATKAEVLYNTFGPGDSYLTYTFDVVGDPSGYGPIVYPGVRFGVGSGNYGNISVTLPLELWNIPSPEDFPFQVNLYANDGTPEPISGDLYPGEYCPGTLLASIDALASDVQSNGPTTFSFDAATLAGDTDYWITLASPLELVGAIKWYLNDREVLGFTAQRVGMMPSFPDEWVLVYSQEAPVPAMRVEGTLVPEPSSLALFLLGIAGALRKR